MNSKFKTLFLIAITISFPIFSYQQIQKTILDKYSEVFVGPSGYYTTMAMEGIPPDFKEIIS